MRIMKRYFIALLVIFSNMAIAAPFAYVAHDVDNSISIIDLSNTSDAINVSVGKGPENIVFHPSADRTYIANILDDTVSVMESANHQIIKTIPVGTAPQKLAIMPSGQKLYVASSNSISAISTANDNVTNTIAIDNPSAIAVSPDGTQLYVANNYLNTVSVFDTAVDQIIATINVGSNPQNIAFNLLHTRAYVANVDSQTIDVIDTIQSKVIETISLGTIPLAMAVNPNGKNLYVTTHDALVSVDTATNSIVATLPIPDNVSSSAAISINAAGTEAYQILPDINQIMVVDLINWIYKQTINVKNYPSTIALSPENPKISKKMEDDAIVCLFNWAEDNFPYYFSAPLRNGYSTQYPYSFRYYVHTNYYIGVSAIDEHVYYLPSGGNRKPIDAGLFSYWQDQAGCGDGLPTITSFTASPNPVETNGAITLQWSSTNVTTCTSNAFGDEIKGGNGSIGINNLTDNQTYTLMCRGNSGSVSKSLIVQVTPQGQVTPPVVTVSAPTISSFTASPNPVDNNGSTTLQWSSSNATKCTSDAWSGSLGASGSKVIPGLTSDQTYNLTCTGTGGSANASVSVTVKPQIIVTPAPSILSFTATPNPVDNNGSTTLQWSSSNAKSCTSNAWNGSLGSSGSKAITGLLSDQTYTLTCTGNGGSDQASVSVSVKPQVIVAPAPTISSFSATPNPVDYNGSTTLQWSSSNATGCTSNAWSGSLGGSGSKVISGLTSDQTYNLTCTGTGGSANASVSVTVKPQVVTPAPTISSFTATPNPVAYNGSTTLQWSSTNATSCSLPSFGSNLSASGSQIVSGLTSDQTYNLTCTGSGGTANSSVSLTVKPQVVVTPAPTISSFTATPNPVDNNGSTTLSWSSSNATDCTSNAWSGSLGSSGSQVISGLTSDQNYNLTCTGSGGTANSSVTVTVKPPVITTSGAYKIGDKGPAGGIVFNVDATGLHGLEAQSQDYKVGGRIGCPGGCTYTYPDGSLLHFYTWSEALTAAQTYGAGWHLPTKDELNLLYQQKNVVSGFTDFCYLSSTEYDASNALQLCFGNGSQAAGNKTTNVSLVRAVRAF